MTTIKFRDKTFYPTVDIHDSKIYIHNDVVVGQFEVEDYEYLKDLASFDSGAVIFDTLDGTLDSPHKGTCQYKSVRIQSLGPNHVTFYYNQVSVKPDVSVQNISIKIL